jgi:GAF domain-containing protein
VNNVLNMQLIEQLIVANDTTPTIAVFCEKVYQAFRSELETFSQLALYQQQGDSFVGQITLPDKKADIEKLASDTHAELWSALMSNQPHIIGSDVYLPLYRGKDLQSILKFVISDTQEQDAIHWSIIKTLLSQEFNPLPSSEEAQINPSQHLLDNMIDTTHQISLAENNAEINQLIFKFLPESVSHIAIYRFDTPILKSHTPEDIRLWLVAERDSTTTLDKQLTLERDSTLSSGLTDKLLNGKLIIKDETGVSTDTLPIALIDSLESMSIQSYVLSGLRVGKKLMGFVVFGSNKPTHIDSQYHRSFRILPDQLAVTYENRDLLRRTEVILMETQVLYAISNELVSTPDLVSMLQVIFLYFGENADSASLLEVEYDSTELVKEVMVRYTLRANNPEISTPNQALTDYVPLEELHKLQKSWLVVETPIYFVDDSSQETTELPNKLFSLQNIASCILIPLIENERITHLISINWKQIHPINTQTRNILKAVRNQLTIIFENQRLLQNAQLASAKLEEQVQVQQALNDLATFASTNRDEKLLLDKGAETLLNTLSIDHVGIMLMDEDGDTANLISNTPELDTDVRQIPVEGDIWDNLAKGKRQLIDNIKTRTDIPEVTKRPLEAINIQSSLLLPLIDLSGKLVGSVGLDNLNSTVSLSEEQIQTARLINTQLSSQLQNLRLLKDSQLFANQMQQIAKFGETVQARLELVDILQTTLHFANRILDIDYVGIVLYDEGMQSLIVKAYHLDDKEVVLPVNQPTIPTENTVIGAVWKTREPIYVRNMTQSQYTNPIATDIKTLYSVALISQGVTRGAIEIGRTEIQSIRNVDRSVLLIRT